jgi:hypothetical protein
MEVQEVDVALQAQLFDFRGEESGEEEGSAVLF